MAFFGEYETLITQGGRLVIPKKIRSQLKGNVFVLTKGFDECLAGYDKKDWDSRSTDLLSISLLETADIEKRRYLFSSQNEIEIDAQGRFVIPRALLKFLGLGKVIVIIGVGDHFEIWDKKRWGLYLKKVKI